MTTDLASVPMSTPYRADLDAQGRVVGLYLTVSEGVTLCVVARGRGVGAPPIVRSRSGILSDLALAPLTSEVDGVSQVLARVQAAAAKGGPVLPEQ